MVPQMHPSKNAKQTKHSLGKITLFKVNHPTNLAMPSLCHCRSLRDFTGSSASNTHFLRDFLRDSEPHHKKPPPKPRGQCHPVAVERSWRACSGGSPGLDGLAAAAFPSAVQFSQLGRFVFRMDHQKKFMMELGEILVQE